jgi:cell division protein FtsW
MIDAPRRPDPVLTVTPLALSIVSLVIVYSASSILGLTNYQDPYYFLFRRTIHLAIGLVAFFALARADLDRIIDKHAGRLFLGVLALLARYLARRGDALRSLRGGFLPALAVGGTAVVLIALQPNLSSAGVLFGVVLGMLFFAGARPLHLLGVCGLGVIGFLGMLATHDYQRGRVSSFLAFLFTGKLDALGSGWQLDQSLIALGSGGLFGRGYGRSLQKFLYLPDPHTDFILAIVGEEGGFLATALLVTVLVVFLARGFRAAFRAVDDRSYLVAAGLTTQFAAYAFVNLGVATGLFPTTGLPLPFVSYGGSALIMNLAAAGMLVNVSARQAKARVPADQVGTRSRQRGRALTFGAVGARGFSGGRR